MKRMSWVLVVVVAMCLMLTACTKAVPFVVSMTQSNASTAIASAGFAVNVITASSDSVPAGTVITQSPAGGSQAQSGSTVTITVSSGHGTTVPTDPDPALEGTWKLTEWYQNSSDPSATNILFNFNNGELTVDSASYSYTTVSSATPRRLDLTDTSGSKILCSYRVENGVLYLGWPMVDDQRPPFEQLDESRGPVYVGSHAKSLKSADDASSVVDGWVQWLLDQAGL